MIDARGLSRLIAPDGAEAKRRMELELAERRVSAESFDPLMSANTAICSNSVSMAREQGLGLAILGDVCPICYLNTAAEQGGHPETTFDNWLERAADEAHARAVTFGLVPSA